MTFIINNVFQKIIIIFVWLEIGIENTLCYRFKTNMCLQFETKIDNLLIFNKLFGHNRSKIQVDQKKNRFIFYFLLNITMQS